MFVYTNERTEDYSTIRRCTNFLQVACKCVLKWDNGKWEKKIVAQFTAT